MQKHTNAELLWVSDVGFYCEHCEPCWIDLTHHQGPHNLCQGLPLGSLTALEKQISSLIIISSTHILLQIPSY